MDDGEKARVRFISGLVVAAFALFTFLSVTSYLFTWKADQSLLRDPAMMSQAEQVANMCGKTGLKWAHFLYGKWFGLGSYALIIILVAIAIRLLLGRWKQSLLRTFFIALSGAIVASFLLAYLSSLTGLDSAFDGGLGGDGGSAVIAWAQNLFGTVISGVLLVILLAGWVFLLGNSFSDWLLSLGQPRAPKEEAEPEESPLPSWMTESKSEPEPEPEPLPEPAPAPARTFPRGQTPVTDPSGEDIDVEEEALQADEAEPGFEIVEGDKIDTEVKKELPRIDNRAELPNYAFPSLDLLDDYSSSRQDISTEELTRNKNKIIATLANYKIQINEVKANVGPTVTLYKVYPAPGVKISAIKSLQEDIAMSLNAKGVRVVTLEDSVGIEVANDRPSIVPLKAMLNDDAFRRSKAELPVAIGYTITQKVKVFDLADAPHLLVAGATKQGKSVGLNVIVASLLYSKHPSELKLVFIDPKMVEFSAYEKLMKHYLAVLPDSADEAEERANCIVKKPEMADKILRSLCVEMDERYALLSQAYVNNIKLYNEKYRNRKLRPDEGHKFLPYIVAVIDEYADLTMSVGAGSEARNLSRSISTSIIRLAQKVRAAGIHVILATQRPSVDVITGLIKTNFPTRIAFRTVSRIDSSTILDSPGAEKLIGKGDMLYYAGVEMERVQCAFISNDEIVKLTDAVGEQEGYKKCYNTPYYLPAPEPDSVEEGTGMIDMKALDERFEEAARLVVTSQRGSTSDLQRRLGMGYAKAGRVMDQLEAAGIVGPQQGSKPRDVLVTDFAALDEILSHYRQ